ncbi:Uncharacterised protein [Mycobacteroides abscessus subsp. abscessus]|nr:Uncharacterised protein [Mycobacteroides abscessus subsp. abscessus]
MTPSTPRPVCSATSSRSRPSYRTGIVTGGDVVSSREPGGAVRCVSR